MDHQQGWAVNFVLVAEDFSVPGQPQLGQPDPDVPDGPGESRASGGPPTHHRYLGQTGRLPVEDSQNVVVVVLDRNIAIFN